MVEWCGRDYKTIKKQTDQNVPKYCCISSVKKLPRSRAYLICVFFQKKKVEKKKKSNPMKQVNIYVRFDELYIFEW